MFAHQKKNDEENFHELGTDPDVDDVLYLMQ